MSLKRQQFRCRLIALLLLTLLGLTGIFGARTIPLSPDSPALREAVLRLTGQETALPADFADSELTPAPEADSALPQSAESPVPADLPGAALTPDAIFTLEVTFSPDETPVPPLSEALSEYFSTVSPLP